MAHLKHLSLLSFTTSFSHPYSYRSNLIFFNLSLKYPHYHIEFILVQLVCTTILRFLTINIEKLTVIFNCLLRYRETWKMMKPNRTVTLYLLVRALRLPKRNFDERLYGRGRKQTGKWKNRGVYRYR